MNYESKSGSKMEVSSKGKNFVVVIDFPASERNPELIPAERKVINCRAWSGVEKQIKKWRMEAV